MSIAQFYSACWENRRLLSLMLELTYACDLRCGFCYNEKDHPGRTLSLEEYRRILREARAEGALFLTLTGGEPTLHRDFFEIGGFADRLGYSVRIKSNGHGFTPSLVRRIKAEVRPYNIDLSIHGAEAATHDAATGVPGSHGRLLEAVRMLALEGIRVRLKFPFTRRNESELDGVLDLAGRLGTKLDIFPEITPKDTGDLSPLGLTASLEGLRRLYRRLRELSRSRQEGFMGEEESDRLSARMNTPFACGAGLSNLMVDPFGGAYGCVAWRDPIGDLRERSVREVWHSPAAARLADLNREAGRRKALNPSLEGEMFCPGRAFIQYGNPLTIYPESVILAKINQQVEKE
jgi:MoaA/NifB/PqqE/SkfB family radical SAM enzyme